MATRTRAVAELRLSSTTEGGRQGPIVSGYYALVWIADRNSDAMVRFSGIGELGPGETARVELEFLFPEHFGDLLRPAAAFEIREGDRLVGSGTIIEVLPR